VVNNQARVAIAGPPLVQWHTTSRSWASLADLGGVLALTAYDRAYAVWS
jgi:hypothetical protein